MSASDQRSDSRELLTQRANWVRAKMLRRIDLLQARRRQLGNVIREIRVEAKYVLPAMAGIALVSAAAITVLLRARATRKRHHQGWRLPLRSEPPRAGFVKRSLQGLVVSLATRLLQGAAKQAVRLGSCSQLRRRGRCPSLLARRLKPSSAYVGIRTRPRYCGRSHYAAAGQRASSWPASAADLLHRRAAIAGAPGS